MFSRWDRGGAGGFKRTRGLDGVNLESLEPRVTLVIVVGRGHCDV